jgi:hypothetical protein
VALGEFWVAVEGLSVLRAIHEYLRAIPSRPDNPDPGP